MKRFYSILLLAIIALPMMGQKDMITTTGNYKIEASIISVTIDSIGYNMPGVPITLSLPMEQVAYIVYRTGDTVRYNEITLETEAPTASESAIREITYDVDIAVVHKFHGIYVYTDCEPLDEYQVLGTVTYSETKGAVSTTYFGGNINFGNSAAVPIYAQYTSLRNGLVRKAMEMYPEAQGIIIEADGEGSAIARVIRYKYDAQYRFARVQKVGGYYIYIDNAPTVNRAILGIVSSVFGESTYTSIRNKLIDKADFHYRKKGNALILTFREGGANDASVETLYTKKE